MLRLSLKNVLIIIVAVAVYLYYMGAPTDIPMDLLDENLQKIERATKKKTKDVPKIVDIPVDLLDENLPDGERVSKNRRLTKQWTVKTKDVPIPRGLGVYFDKGDKEIVASDFYPVAEVAPYTEFVLSVEILTGNEVGEKSAYFSFRNKDNTIFGAKMWVVLEVVDNDGQTLDALDEGTAEFSESHVFKLWNAAPIERVDVSKMTFERFHKYAEKNVPLILTGAFPESDRVHFSFNEIKATCGDKLVPTTRASSYPRKDCEWANLCSHERYGLHAW